MFILILACVLIIFPIFAVQIGRISEAFHDYAGSALLTSKSGDVNGVDGSADMKKETGKQAVQYNRKPWDPPFPNSPDGSKKMAGYPSLPPMQPSTMNENRMRPLSPGPPRLHTPTPQPQLQIVRPSSVPPDSLSDGHDVIRTQHVSTVSPAALSSPLRPSKPLSTLQAIASALAILIFIFVLAVIVAHCLAWFIVYKTEARLGELRKGLLRGGDMRVCLCAK